VAGTVAADGELETTSVTMDVMTVGPEGNEEVMRDVTSDGVLDTTGWVMIEVMTEGVPDTVTVMREVTTPL